MTKRAAKKSTKGQLLVDNWDDNKGAACNSTRHVGSEIAVSGRAVFVLRYKPHAKFWANLSGRHGHDYTSRVFVDPTWDDVLECATAAIQTTGDWHHVFLEDIREVKGQLSPLEEMTYNEDVRFYELGLGS